MLGGAPRGRGPRLVVCVVACAVLGLLAAVAVPAVADARGRDPETSVVAAARCGGGASSDLRLRRRSGALDLRLEIDHAPPASTWRIVIVHERRVVLRVSRRTDAAGELELEARLPDLPGTDTVTVRAWGPADTTCAVVASVS